MGFVTNAASTDTTATGGNIIKMPSDDGGEIYLAPHPTTEVIQRTVWWSDRKPYSSQADAPPGADIAHKWHFSAAVVEADGSPVSPELMLAEVSRSCMNDIKHAIEDAGVPDGEWCVLKIRRGGTGFQTTWRASVKPLPQDSAVRAYAPMDVAAALAALDGGSSGAEAEKPASKPEANGEKRSGW